MSFFNEQKTKRMSNMNKVFLSASISLLSIVIIVVSLTSSGLIKGVSKEKQLAEVKGTTISITNSPTPRITPTPTILIKKQLEVETYIAPTLIPTLEPTAIPTIQKPDNRAKLDAIANQFKKIAELNTQITTYQIIAEDALKNYTCEPDANIFNPFDRDALYQKCLSTQYSLSYAPQISGLKNQIRDINSQVQGIIATCSGSECNDYYWELVNGFEAKGFMVR